MKDLHWAIEFLANNPEPPSYLTQHEINETINMIKDYMEGRELD